MLVRNNLIPMGKQMKRKQNSEKRNVKRSLKEEHPKNNNNAVKILQLKQRLKEIEENEMIGAAIRSRTEWREEGEKPTKFFFNLEKQKGEEKQLNEIRDENGDILKTIYFSFRF